jgi:hypothetical protein
MAAITSAIRADLRRILLATPGLPAGIGFKWEMMKYSPVIGVPYIRESLQPIASVTATLGSWGSQEEAEIYNLDLYMPDDRPLTEGSDLADAIRCQFWAGRAIGSAAPTPMWGNVERAEKAPPIEGDGWNVYPNRIRFFVRRPTRMV